MRIRAARQTGANLGFEDKLWMAADKLRGTMDAAEYKHVVLGLIFLKYISDAFADQYAALEREPYADPEDRDEYLAANVFWVPGVARWAFGAPPAGGMRKQKDGAYEDRPGFCKSAALNDIASHDFVLTPGRYVGAEAAADDGIPLRRKWPNSTAPSTSRCANRLNWMR